MRSCDEFGVGKGDAEGVRKRVDSWERSAAVGIGGKEVENCDESFSCGGKRWMFWYQRGPAGLCMGYRDLREIKEAALQASASVLNQGGSSGRGSGMREVGGRWAKR